MTGKYLIPSSLRMLTVLLLVFWGVGIAVSQVGQQQGSPVQAGVQQAQVTVGSDIVYYVQVRVQSAGENIGVAVPVLSPDTGMSSPVPVPNSPVQSRSYVTINGRSSYTEDSRYIYTIKTSKEGRFQIPPATVTIGGKNIETEAVDISVVSAPQVKDLPAELKGIVVPPAVPNNPDLQNKLTGAIFIMPVLSTNTPYNGEQVRIAYHLVIDPKALQQAGLQPMTNLQNVSIPPMTDFIKEELYPFPSDIKFEEREIGGRTYSVAPIYEAVISSTKTGDLSIEPFQISMGFTMRGSRRGFPDFPNDPFGSPFGLLSGNSENVIAQSPRLSLEVKPVPSEGRPADYNGAVGQFTVAAQVDKKQAKAYEETIKLDVTVSGEGNADTMSPPTLPAMDGFTVLGDPQQEAGGRKDGKQYVSVKKFTYNLRPTKPGDVQIPPISIAAFDPKTQSFQQVASDAIEIKVLPGSRPVPQVDSTPAAGSLDEPDQPAPKPEEKDYRYIYTGSLRRQGHLDSLFDSPLVYALFALPIALAGAALGAAALKRRSQLHAGDSTRQHKAGAVKHLRNARAALDSSQSDSAVYSSLAEGIRLHFASRYSIPLGEATILEIENRLKSSGMPSEKVQELSDLLERCDSVQYGRASSGSLAREDVALAESLIKESEKYS